jgi:hypothetical protein
MAGRPASTAGGVGSAPFFAKSVVAGSGRTVARSAWEAEVAPVAMNTSIRRLIVSSTGQIPDRDFSRS